MSPQAMRGGRFTHRKPLSRWFILLAASLLLVVGSACNPGVQTKAALTPTAYSTITSQPPSAATRTEAGSQNQPSTPAATQAVTPSASTTLPIYTQTTTPSPPAPVGIVFAAIGDYGSGNQNEADVANEILSWQPDFIITLGDNNYPSGSAEHMDVAVGQYFHAYIFPYQGNSGVGADINRFFPCLGNHDWITDSAKPYLDYFTLPGNERYYDFSWGPVHFFALDDIEREPDGVGQSSIQAQWLKAGLAASTSAWNIVYMHYAPYSSGTHGSTDWARWPYKEWGADAVLAGHDHTYERLDENGLVYFVNGLGGDSRYDFPEIIAGSQVRYNSDYGAMRVEASETHLVFEFITRGGELVDRYELGK